MSYISPDPVKKALSNLQGLSAIHINARSLRNNYDNISTFIDSLEHSFSLLCFSETWLTPSDKNLFNIPGYSSEYCHRSEDPYGGSGLYIHKNIAYKRRLDLSLNVHKCESVWVELDTVPTCDNSYKTVCGTIYRSPSSQLSAFFSAFSLVLDRLSLENKNVIILGDININILDASNSVCSEYMSCFSSYGFQSLISVPTRCSNRGSESLLDHILSNFVTSPTVGVIETLITDHFPVFLCFDTRPITINKPNFRTFFDREKYFDLISNTDWSPIFNCSDPEVALDQFCTVINCAVNNCTTVNQSNWKYSSPRAPWLTTSLLRSLRKKDNLYKKTKRQPFNDKLKTRLNNYGKILSLVLKRAKRKYYEKRLQECGNDVKKKWKILNEFLNQVQQPDRVP